MKLSTLKEIEKALNDSVDNERKLLEKAREHYNRVLDLKDSGSQKYEEKSEVFWYESKKKHLNRVCELEQALEDFLNHDWK